MGISRVQRRVFVKNALAVGGGLTLLGASGLSALGSQATSNREVPKAILEWAEGRPLNYGRVRLVLPPLVENGFLVRTSVRVEGPMTEADHVQELRLFSEVNPSPFIANFYLSPQLPEARVETRIRLADTQAVWAVARTNKGQFWCSYQQVIVTLAACAG